MLIFLSMSGSVVVVRSINSRSLMGWVCMSFILLGLRGSGCIVMWIVQSSSYQLPSLTNLQQYHVWGSDNPCAVTIVIGWVLDVTFLTQDIPNHTKITAESELWIQFAYNHVVSGLNTTDKTPMTQCHGIMAEVFCPEIISHGHRTLVWPSMFNSVVPLRGV